MEQKNQILPAPPPHHKISRPKDPLQFKFIYRVYSFVGNNMVIL
jgi:hypothetical protein